MNRNEKRVIGTVVVIFTFIMGYTIYLEMQSQHAPTRLAQELANEELTHTTTASLKGIPKGFNAVDLPDEKSRGAEVLKLYCIQCHELVPPSMHSAEGWDEVLARMDERMRARKGGMFGRVLIPADRDWQILREYLHHYGQKALDVTTLDDLQSPGGQAFSETCGQCHRLPDPSQHTAKEWHRTVLRMRANMESVGMMPPEARKIELIIDYLQAHASQGATAG